MASVGSPVPQEQRMRQTRYPENIDPAGDCFSGRIELIRRLPYLLTRRPLQFDRKRALAFTRVSSFVLFHNAQVTNLVLLPAS